MKIKFLLLITIILLIPTIKFGFTTPSNIEQVSPMIELFSDVILEMNREKNQSILETSFLIDYFRDITYLEFNYEETHTDLKYFQVLVEINDFEKIVDISQDTLDEGRFFIILDSNAVMNIKYPHNEIKISFRVEFLDKAIFFDNAQMDLKLVSISLNTLYQNDPILIDSDTVDIRKEAILIPDAYYNVRRGVIDFFQSNMEFIVVLPREINVSYVFNLTITSNRDIEIRNVFMEHFGVKSQVKNNLSHSIEFSYIESVSYPITTLRVEVGIDKDFWIEVEGFFKVTRLYEEFPRSEFDFLLFFIVTAVIPTAFLSKLFYKRLLNYI